jgi:hypothetical protein
MEAGGVDRSVRVVSPTSIIDDTIDSLVRWTVAPEYLKEVE